MATATLSNAAFRRATGVFDSTAAVTVSISTTAVAFTAEIGDQQWATIALRATTDGIAAVSVPTEALMAAAATAASTITVEINSDSLTIAGSHLPGALPAAGELHPPRHAQPIDASALIWVASVGDPDTDTAVLDAVRFAEQCIEATDGYRLHQVELGPNREGVVPAALLRAVSAFAPTTIDVAIDAGTVVVHSETADTVATAAGPLVTDAFPATAPLHGTTTVSFDAERADLLAAINQAAKSIAVDLGVPTQTTNVIVTITVADDLTPHLEITDGDAVRRIDADLTPATAAGAVSVDATSLTAALSGTATTVTLSLSSPMNPLKVTGVGRVGRELAFVAGRNLAAAPR